MFRPRRSGAEMARRFSSALPRCRSAFQAFRETFVSVCRKPSIVAMQRANVRKASARKIRCTENFFRVRQQARADANTRTLHISVLVPGSDPKLSRVMKKETHIWRRIFTFHAILLAAVLLARGQSI